MKKFSKLGQALSIVALLGALWLIYTILVFSFEESESNNSNYIPVEASVVYQLNGRILSRELLASLLISEDEELQQLVQSKIPTTGQGNLKPVGIHFDSEIILFRLEENGNSFTGFLFNLRDPKLFNKNIPKYLSNNSVCTSNPSVGLILMQREGGLTKEELRTKAKKMLAHPTTEWRKGLPQDGNSLISISYREKGFTTTDLGVSVQENQLIFNGSLHAKNANFDGSTSGYKGGFHVHSKWLPQKLKHELKKGLQSIGIDVPPLKQFSLNYFGSKIVTEPNIAGLPYLAGILEFETSVVPDSIFKDFKLVSTDTLTNTKVYDILSMRYAITQQNATTIEIKSLEGIHVNQTMYGSIAEISGAPKHILKLEGDQFIRGILTLTNEYKSLSAFVNEIEEIDIKITPSSSQSHRIHGKIALKNDKWPLNELIKFLIQSNLL